MSVEALLEVITLPVADPDRSIRFYRDQIGFILDVDYAPSPKFRVVQLTPPGSRASIQFGVGLPDVPPGKVTGMYLVVADIEAYTRQLIARGVRTTDIRHKFSQGGWCGSFRPGPDPGRTDYASFAAFTDPDGNRWVIQERGHPASASHT